MEYLECPVILGAPFIYWNKSQKVETQYSRISRCPEPQTESREETPRLSVSVYHGYDDLWRLPKLIHELNSSYRFYLRYYGGNLFPTEIVLTALPGEKEAS